MNSAIDVTPERGRTITGKVSDAIWRNPKMFLFFLLLPPVLWLGIVYVGSLIALLVQSFFSIDEFTGLVKREFTFKTYGELLHPANLDIIVRTITTAIVVTLSAAIVAFPIAYYAARYARGKWKAIFYLGIMLPLFVIVMLSRGPAYLTGKAERSRCDAFCEQRHRS